MSKFAHYDPAAPAPQPVLGWFDTDAFAYAALPAAETLLVVDPATWTQRLEDPSAYVVSNGGVVRGGVK